MPFSALLFDLDGTLVDSHHEICLALDRALRDVGFSFSFSQVEALVDGSPLEVIWATLHPDLTLRADVSAYMHFVRAYRDHYMRDLGHASALYPNVIETLLSLQLARPGLRFAVVSNKSPNSVAPLLEAVGIASHFTVMLGCGGTHIPAKPEPDLLLAAAQELNCPAARCIMIGDTVLDIRAGRRAGMPTIGMAYGLGGRGALEKEGADHVLDTFEDLARILRETQG